MSSLKHCKNQQATSPVDDVCFENSKQVINKIN